MSNFHFIFVKHQENMSTVYLNFFKILLTLNKIPNIINLVPTVACDPLKGFV